MAISWVFNPFTGNLDAVDGTGSGSTSDHNHTATAGDGGVLTNDVHDGYIDITNIPTPSNPAIGTGRIFMRTGGNNIEYVFRSATGEECILCTLVNVVHVNTLALNWIE